MSSRTMDLKFRTIVERMEQIEARDCDIPVISSENYTYNEQIL